MPCSQHNACPHDSSHENGVQIAAPRGEPMLIRELSRDECIALLARNRLAHVACALEGQPYVVPLNFAYDDESIYAFSTVGRKIDWMRQNERVCVEVDELTSSEQWASVIVLGRFKELVDVPKLQGARAHAYRVLSRYAGWWSHAYLRVSGDHEVRALDPVYYRISIDEITGRRATPT
jgi:nitroimidazol reductase NimA-like FMN-containing flavoprotein (pyridoxamine 5'-phosphate oxidase superfamily)